MKSELSVKSPEMKEIPKGARITRKSKTTSVEKIENGYIITENWDISYEYKEGKETRNDYKYITKKYYSKEDPVEFTGSKALSELFEDEDEE